MTMEIFLLNQLTEDTRRLHKRTVKHRRSDEFQLFVFFFFTVVYYLLKNFRTFSWDVNGKTVLICPNGNFPK